MLAKKSIVLALMLICLVLIYADNQAQPNMININPNPVDKSTVISVSFSERVRANIIIETSDGTLIKTMFSGNLDAGVYEYFWNRVSNTGSYVPEGKYSVTVNYESRYTSTKKTIILK